MNSEEFLDSENQDGVMGDSFRPTFLVFVPISSKFLIDAESWALAYEKRVFPTGRRAMLRLSKKVLDDFFLGGSTLVSGLYLSDEVYGTKKFINSHKELSVKFGFNVRMLHDQGVHCYFSVPGWGVAKEGDGYECSGRLWDRLMSFFERILSQYPDVEEIVWFSSRQAVVTGEEDRAVFRPLGESINRMLRYSPSFAGDKRSFSGVRFREIEVDSRYV